MQSFRGSLARSLAASLAVMLAAAGCGPVTFNGADGGKSDPAPSAPGAEGSAQSSDVTGAAPVDVAAQDPAAGNPVAEDLPSEGAPVAEEPATAPTPPDITDGGNWVLFGGPESADELDEHFADHQLAERCDIERFKAAFARAAVPLTTQADLTSLSPEGGHFQLASDLALGADTVLPVRGMMIIRSSDLLTEAARLQLEWGEGACLWLLRE